MARTRHQLSVDRVSVDRKCPRARGIASCLARVRAATTLPIAAGENAAGVHDLATMLRAGSIDICQPSVIKIGGIEAVAQAAILARVHGVDYVPHCFYFGPGFLG